MNDAKDLQQVEVALKSERAKIKREIYQGLMDLISEPMQNSNWKWRVPRVYCGVNGTEFSPLTLESFAAMLEEGLYNLDDDPKG
jgi:hypothetical protein